MSAHTGLTPRYGLVRATLYDAPDIYRLERAAFPRDAYDPLTIALLLVEPGTVNLKAVTAEGALVGHITGRRRWFSDLAWIVTLAVAPAHQRHGIGRSLLTACEAHLNRPRVRLTVRVGNAPAIALYSQMGYSKARVWRRYYRGGEDGLVMEKHFA